MRRITLLFFFLFSCSSFGQANHFTCKSLDDFPVIEYLADRSLRIHCEPKEGLSEYYLQMDDAELFEAAKRGIGHCFLGVGKQSFNAKRRNFFATFDGLRLDWRELKSYFAPGAWNSRSFFGSWFGFNGPSFEVKRAMLMVVRMHLQDRSCFEN